MTHVTEAPLTEFVDRYLRVWHEPDPQLRQELVSSLWAPDAVEYTDTREHRGHAELEARVAEACIEFVQKGGFVFRLEGEPATLHRAVSLTIGMRPSSGGQTVWMGSIFALLNDEGLMQREYQFGRFLVTQ